MSKYFIIIFTLILFVSESVSAENKTLIVAGGCFWCVESDFEKYKGVISAESGYTGGRTENPTYKKVSYDDTGHFEAVKITYDSEQVSLNELVEYFWKTIDPTDAIGQFCDKGSSYKSALFYQDENQKSVFDRSLANLNKSKPFKGDVVTDILSADTFYSAEEYHQDYYKKNPLRYRYYRNGCGRDKRIKSLWGEVASKNNK